MLKFVPVMLISFVSSTLPAQTTVSTQAAQEAFAVAVAKSHAKTNLFTTGAKPFTVHAVVTSAQALHAVGQGTFEEKWVDAEHWEQKIRFSDFQEEEMRNDSGHYWIERSPDFLPLRASQMIRFMYSHVPSSTEAGTYSVVQSNATGELAEPLTCFSAEKPTPSDEFPRRFRWCFDTATGLLHSEDMPLDTHVTFGKYIAFQGMQEYTEVNVSAGKLPVLTMHLSYAPLDTHSLDSQTPFGEMKRAVDTDRRLNPGELEKSMLLYRTSAVLPPDTPDTLADKSVLVHILWSDTGTPVDVSVEQAPTSAMAAAALQAASKFNFIPARVDGKAVAGNQYASIWFQPKDISIPPPVARDRGSDSPAPVASVAYPDIKGSFVFRYPADFERLPQGLLDEEQRRELHETEAQAKDVSFHCATTLLKLQKLLPGHPFAEAISIFDLDPGCVFGPLDSKQLESMAASSARRVLTKWKNGIILSSQTYSVDGRPFAVVFATASLPTSSAEIPIHIILTATEISGRAVGWLLQAPDQDLLNKLASSTLQIGKHKEFPLVPTAVLANP